MPAEDGTHFFSEENRAAPAVGDAHGGERPVHMADAFLEQAEAGGRFTFAYIIAMQIVGAVFGGVSAERKAGRRV